MLFSLQGLMDREKERVEQEAQGRRQAIERENQMRLERERREHEEAERREREAHERALREEVERRAHEARLEAAKMVEIERVRLEAESRTRLDTATMQQEHDRRMAALELASRVRRFRAFAVGGVFVGLVTLAVALGLYFGKLRPQQDHIESAYAQVVSSQHARADEVQALAEKQKQKQKKLEKALRATKQELADARREIEDFEHGGPRHRGARRAAPVRPKPSAQHAVCTGDSYDPLNGCLGSGATATSAE